MTNRLWWLALGAFAVGSEAFMLTGLLANIAHDLSVSGVEVGYLVTIYAVVYAFGAPVLAAAFSGAARKRVLVCGMVLFAFANVLAAMSPQYWPLFCARAAAALSAALFMPAAFAYAGTAVDPSRRGQALAIVGGGLSTSIAFGAPLATWIALTADWRLPFLVVAAIALVAALGIGLFISATPKAPAISLRMRLAPAKNPDVVLALSVAVFWTMGSFSAFVYLGPLLQALAGIDGVLLALALLVSGTCGIVGTFIGGRCADQFGPEPVLHVGLLFFAAVFAAFSCIGLFVSPQHALLPALIGVGLWGMVSWALNSAQQVRLLKLAPDAPSFVLSLNSSAVYLGIALGSSLGATILTVTSVTHLGWVAGSCEFIAFVLMVISHRRLHARASNSRAGIARG